MAVVDVDGAQGHFDVGGQLELKLSCSMWIYI